VLRKGKYFLLYKCHPPFYSINVHINYYIT